MSPTSKRRRFRLGLRGALLAVAIVGVALGLWAQRARRERDAARWVAAVGGRFYYEDQLDADGNWRDGDRAAGPAWVRRHLGDEFTRRIAAAEIDQARSGRPEGLPTLAALPGLRYLHLQGAAFGDAHMAEVGRMTRLRELSLDNTKVSDAGLAHLARLHQLQSLNFANSRITGRGLDALLPHLPRLKHLSLDYTYVDPRDMDRLDRQYPALTITRSY